MQTLVLICWAIFQQLCFANVVVFDWNITRINVSFDGVERSVIGVNGRPAGQFPIVVTIGDDVQVITRNLLNEPIALHWHGLLMIGTPEMDGAAGITQCPIQPGKTLVYKFTPDKPGTFWWHDHQKALYVDGLRGPLIVKEMQSVLDVAVEYTLQLTEWHHLPSEELIRNMENITANPSGFKPLWNSVLINERGRYNCSTLDKSRFPVCTEHQPLASFAFEHGKKYYMRLINVAGFVSFNFSIDNHQFQVVAIDAVPVQPTKLLTSIEIDVAQRYDILVMANATPNGRYFIRATSLTGTGYTQQTTFPVGFNPNGLAIIEYDQTGKISVETSDPDSQPCRASSTLRNDIDIAGPNSQPCGMSSTLRDDIDFLPTDLTPVPETPDVRIIQEYTISNTLSPDPRWLGYLSMDRGPYQTFQLSSSPPLFSAASGDFNFSSAMNPYIMQRNLNYEVVILGNNPSRHPFHLHGYTVQVLGKGHIGLDALNSTSKDGPIPKSLLNFKNPPRRDVYVLPGCHSDQRGVCLDLAFVVIRIYADNPGTWVHHCHIEWHLVTGFAMLFITDPEYLARKGLNAIDPSVRSTCDS